MPAAATTPDNHPHARALSIARYDMLDDNDDDDFDFDCPRSPARRRAPPAPVHGHVKNAQMATGSAARPATPPINILLPPPPPPPPNTQPAPPPDEPLLHSPPSAGPALCHPTPDLQALQGAYVSNVERLEQSAERLSLALERRHDSFRTGTACRAPPALGSPPGSLLLASRRPSYSPAAAAEHSPIRPRPTGYASSIHSSSSLRQSARPSLSSQQPRPSLRSGSMASRLARVVEPPGMTTAIPPQLPELPLSPPHDAILGPLVADGQEELQQQQLERPGSAGSGDTYRQATELFKDFDGVHYTPPPQPPPPLLLAGMPNAHQMPARGENMVYYPAPVPMMLNLPQRLSKRPVDQEKRRTQVMSSLPPDKRKSAIWANPIDGDVDPAAPTAAAARQSKRISQMPPQLRASAFFEVPPTQLDITVKENSAVATLDSILDAAALAPVSAFTDHPIVGQAGAGVYGKEKGKKKGKLEKKKRDSEMPIAGEGPNQSFSTPDPRASFAEENQAVDEQTPFRSSNDRDREDPDRYVGSGEPKSDDRAESDNDENADDDDEEEDEEDAFVGPPTTLLAELQMRKQEQKQRNRTAATAFPNGMHSTLLELDAVAQRQRDNRDRRHVVLAWEDPALADRREPDDDDVPLALLFPDKNKQADENRPLGLMEKLELDENEPLSRRRARIRGEPAPLPRPLTTVYPPAAQQQQHNHHRASTAFTLDVPGLEESDGDEHEHETLAQRVRRLKTQDEKGASSSSAAAAVPGSSDFASELLSRFGDEPPADTKPASPEEEETLGQRRKRLQAEAQAQAQAGGHKVAAARRSMANILHASPVGMQPPAAVGSRQSLPASGAGYSHNNPRLSRTLTGGGSPLLNFGPDMSPGPTPYYPTGLVAPAFGNGLSAVNLNPHFYAAQHQQQQMMTMMRRGTEAEPVIDQSQRDMIDRWRLGVQ
ncbi:hypothetical protein LOZ65_003655 [Ophidiomyces ophidiicola]|nr:hypothetical protein LOZ65_003655 [Ophidiomyces ophidiicola]